MSFPLASPRILDDNSFTTRSEDQVRSVPSIALAVCAIGFCVSATSVIFASSSRFSQMIEEFEVDVSVVTWFAVGPVLPVLFAIVVLAVVVKEFVPGLGAVRDWCNCFVLLFGASALATYLIGIFAPLMSLLEGLT